MGMLPLMSAHHPRDFAMIKVLTKKRAGIPVDSAILADQIHPRSGERLAELGTGNGLLAAKVAQNHPGVVIDTLEIQEQWLPIARKNLAARGLANQVRVIAGDVRNPPAEMGANGYHQVFCNPPYFLPEAGRLPTDPIRAASRFEIFGKLADFFRCAGRLLKEGGLFQLVHRPERLVEILACLPAEKLTPLKLVPVFEQWHKPAVLVLITAQKMGKTGLTLAPPLILGQTDPENGSESGL